MNRGLESGSPGRGRVKVIAIGGVDPRTRKGNPEESLEESWGLGAAEGLQGGKGALGKKRGPQKGKESNEEENKGLKT